MGSETTFFSFCKRLHLSKLSSSVKDLAEDPEIIAALQSALTVPLSSWGLSSVALTTWGALSRVKCSINT